MQQISYDRFSNRNIEDIQDLNTYAYCDYCRYEIAFGDSYLESPNGDILHDERECLIGFYQLYRKWAGGDIV